MKPRPYTRGIGQSPFEACFRTLGARAHARCEQLDNIRSGPCPLHPRTGGGGCAFPILPPPPWRREIHLAHPLCAPTPEPSAQLYLRGFVWEQSQGNSAPHSRLDRNE